MNGKAEHDLQLSDPAPQISRLAQPDAITLAVLVVVMVGIAMGAFGRGPISRAHLTSPSSQLAAEFERFERFGASTRLTISIGATGASSELFIANEYLEAMQLQRMVPTPVAERALADGVAYQFATASPRYTVLLDVQPLRRGRIAGRIAAAGETLRWTQFIYP